MDDVLRIGDREDLKTSLLDELRGREMYTIETLIKQNPSYHSEHNVTQSDVDKVNALINLIEASRREDTPLDGDLVLCFKPGYGQVCDHGHVELIDDRITICTRPYAPPFIDKALNCEASGGPWFGWSLDEFLAKARYVRRRHKAFKVWGHCGMCGNGAVEFSASVSVWQLEDDQFYR